MKEELARIDTQPKAISELVKSALRIASLMPQNALGRDGSRVEAPSETGETQTNKALCVSWELDLTSPG